MTNGQSSTHPTMRPRYANSDEESSSDSEDDQPLVISPEQAAYNEQFRRDQERRWREREQLDREEQLAYYSEEAVAERHERWERVEMQLQNMHDDVARSMDYDSARWAS